MNRTAEIRQLTWMRILQFVREPEALFWVFVFPVVLALVLGLAFQNRGGDVALVGVVDDTLRPDWLQALEIDPRIEVVRFADPERAARKLRSGAVAVIASGRDRLTLRYDPARSEAEAARLRVDGAVQTAAGRTDVVEVRSDVVTETGSRYIDFLIPGLLGMNLMGTGIWSTGFGIADMRQKKLLKLFLVTPMHKSSFLLAQVFSRFFFLVLEVGIIVLFGVLVLDVPFRGDLASFSLLCSLGALCFSGLGLLVASRATTVEGASGLMNFAMMPMWLLSGVFFSYEKYPDVLHPFIRVLPLTALNDGLRDLMLEGESLVHILPEVGVQTAWMVGTFFLALKIFRWR